MKKLALLALSFVLVCAGDVFAGQKIPKKILADGTIQFQVNANNIRSWDVAEDLGNTPVGMSRQFQMAWGNINAETVSQQASISSITGTSAITLTDDGCMGRTLYLGDSCVFTFHYQPTTKALMTASIVLAWSTVWPNSTVTPDSHTFGFFGSSFDTPPKNPPIECASIIDVAGQSLGEVVPLVGIPFNLFYTTKYAPEYTGTTAAFTPAFGFNLQGWTIEVHHLYLKDQHRLFLGNGTVAGREYMTLSNDNLMVTSLNEDEVYIFSPTGKHLETRTFLTGVLKYSFTYDSNSRLVQITDAYNKATTITRNSSGYITSITGPFGQVTTLTTNSNGLLSSVTNPNSEAYSFTYKTGTGLLETFTKPGGQVSTFTYDSNGLLTKDLGHGGNFWELTPQTGGVVKSSQMGRDTSYLSSYNGDGSFLSTETDPSGYSVFRTEFLNGGSYADYQHTQVETYITDDPRFGSIHKRLAGTNVTTGGMSMGTNISQNVQYADGVIATPFNFSILKTETVAGNMYTTEIFDNTSKTRTFTSNQGVVTKINYDNYEKPLSIKLGSDVPRTFSYNSLGQLVFTSQGSKNQTAYEYNNQGLVKSITNNRSESTFYNYDLSGRKISTITSDGRAVQFGYDANGNMTSLTPPSKPTHYFEVNAMELSSKYLPPALSGVTSKDTVYAYNLDKQLTSITNPTGDVLTFNYNSTTGQLQSVTSPVDVSNHEFTYVSNSHQVSMRKTPLRLSKNTRITEKKLSQKN